MTTEQAHHFASEWIAAWNSHDLDQILAHYTDDIEFASPFVASVLGDDNGQIIGKAALRDYFAKALATYPDLRFELMHVLLGAGSVTLLYRSVKNLLAAEVMLFDGEGKVNKVLAHYGS